MSRMIKVSDYSIHSALSSPIVEAIASSRGNDGSRATAVALG